ncbi:MAG: hypothetical protein R3F20_09080 [Planctomycetota bacterium]
MSRVLLCVALLLSGRLPVIAQGYPAWYEDPRHEGRFVPPEYTGGNSGTVGILLSKDRRIVPGGCATLWWTTTSGEIGISDRRKRRDDPSAEVDRLTVATGLDRIHGFRRLTRKGELPTSFLLCGWEKEHSRCALRELVLPESGPPTVTPWGPVSAPGEIWVANSLIEGDLYVHEINSSTIRRWLDTDGDGIPETPDASYAVPVVTEFGAEGFILSLGLIRAFSRSPSGDIWIWSATDLVGKVVEDADGRRRIVAIPRYEEAIGRLADGLVAGQERVYVTGSPGFEFYVQRRVVSGATTRVSAKVIIPRSGGIGVDLTAPLEVGDAVRIVAPDDPAFRTIDRKVAASPVASLFPPAPSVRLIAGERWTLEGWGFRDEHIVRAKVGTRILTLTARHLGATAIEVELPELGPPGERPSYAIARPVLVWIEHGGEAVSNSRVVRIYRSRPFSRR